eukprot:13270_1
MTKAATDEIDDESDESQSLSTLSICTIEPLTPLDQIKSFVTGFMPCTCPNDIISFIATQFFPVTDGFLWRLGLLKWRPYTRLTHKMVQDTYGHDPKLLHAIVHAISECIWHHQFDAKAIKNDIVNTSASVSCLVSYVIKAISPDKTKGLPLWREKSKVHHMLYDIVSHTNTRSRSTSRKPSLITPQPICIHSTPINISVLALECMPSPTMGLALQSSITLSAMSPLSLTDIALDISNPFPGDEDSSYGEPSYIFDTLCHEYPEKTENDVRRLYKLVSTFNETPGSKDMEYIHIDACTDDALMQHCMDLLQSECPSFIPKNGFKPPVVAKAIDIMNRVPVTMNIVNLFTEIRMASHYIEMLKRDTDSDESECATNNENMLCINEFLRNYPLFVSLRGRLKHQEAIHCLSSSVTHIVNKVLCPLPLQPTHVIHDTYSDFLIYLTQISRFIHNKNRLTQYDHMILNALPFPIQIDFMIIPQSVSERKIKPCISGQVIHNYEEECEQLLFGIGEETIGSIGDQLSRFGIECKEIEIDREPAHFYKTLCRQFEMVQNKKRHQRYVIVIDRRNPDFDGRYALNHHDKDWKDRLYIFGPPQCHTISKQCDVLPEGFVHRTQHYLLPFKRGVPMGANCVANGYMFCLSYHLYQEGHIKTYFHYNGYGQRFTRDEVKYYIPRLFMKIDGKPQHEMNIVANKQILETFKDTKDEQHIMFHQQTMK